MVSFNLNWLLSVHIALTIAQAFRFKSAGSKSISDPPKIEKDSFQLFLYGENVSDTSHKDKFDHAYHRPNFVKTERCTGEAEHSCEECTAVDESSSDCFNLYNQYWSKVTLKNPKWTRFRQTFTLNCSGNYDAAYLKMKVVDNKDIFNWRIIINGVTASSLSTSKKQTYFVRISDFHAPIVEGHIEASIKPHAFKETSAGFRVKVFGVDPSFVECEDSKMCLAKLGGSDSGKLLRNNNSLQLECLSDSVQRQSADLQATCSSWRKCLEGAHQEDQLKLLLKAGLGAEDVAQVEENNCEDAHGCLDPSLTDVEGWDCNCFQQWKDRCAAIGFPDSHRCHTAVFCSSNLVCDCWKHAHCDSDDIVELMRLLDNNNTATTALVEEGLVQEEGAVEEKDHLVTRLSHRSAGITAHEQLDESLKYKETC